MKRLKNIEARYYRNGRMLGADLCPLFEDEHGELFVRINEDVYHPVIGHHRETALKGEFVRVGG